LKRDLNNAKIKSGQLSENELHELENEIEQREEILVALLPYNVTELHEATIGAWAAHHYNVNRKGFMRKAVPLEELMVWEGKPLKIALMKLPSEDTKDAVRFNKSMLNFTGDRSSSKSEDEHLHKMLAIAKTASGALRDEIYCQLCKHTSSNPNAESLVRAWKLMVLCVGNFPPTSTFEPFLTNYFTAHYTQQEQEGIKEGEEEEEEAEEEEEEEEEEADSSKPAAVAVAVSTKEVEEVEVTGTAKEGAKEKGDGDATITIQRCAKQCHLKLPLITRLGACDELMPYAQAR
jgi:hypothetical protein